jgi:AcrR family transcriptional regulator
MSSKERLSEFNRSNILDAARKLFLSKGIGQTTMDEIAKEADYSKSTVYVYFKSKDEIYNHIILEHFVLLKEAFEAALKKAPGFPEFYYAICDALALFNDAYPLFFESILGEIKLPEAVAVNGDKLQSGSKNNMADEADVLARIYYVGEEVNRIIMDYFSECADAKKITLEVSPLETTMILWAGITGIIQLADKKETYLKMTVGISKQDFMKDGFRVLLKSII